MRRYKETDTMLPAAEDCSLGCCRPVNQMVGLDGTSNPRTIPRPRNEEIKATFNGPSCLMISGPSRAQPALQTVVVVRLMRELSVTGEARETDADT